MADWLKGWIAKSTATGVAEIAFENLDNWQDIKAEFSGLQTNSGTPDVLIQLGVDGVYDSTNYVTIGNTGTNGIILQTGLAAATSMGGIVKILHFNLARSTWASINCGRDASTTGRRNNTARNTASTAFNCLKFLNSTATNFTANGGIYLYGRTP